jgi:hypothetical protein
LQPQREPQSGDGEREGEREGEIEGGGEGEREGDREEEREGEREAESEAESEEHPPTERDPPPERDPSLQRKRGRWQAAGSATSGRGGGGVSRCPTCRAPFAASDIRTGSALYTLPRSTTALLRLYYGSIKALLRHY